MVNGRTSFKSCSLVPESTLLMYTILLAFISVIGNVHLRPMVIAFAYVFILTSYWLRGFQVAKKLAIRIRKKPKCQRLITTEAYFLHMRQFDRGDPGCWLLPPHSHSRTQAAIGSASFNM